MEKIAVIIVSLQGMEQALRLRKELDNIELFYTGQWEHCTPIDSIPGFVAANFTRYDALVFIGALGICVRAIAPCVQSKHTDPAIVNIDSTGKNVISVLSGHIGGANQLTRRLANILGAFPVITTQSDNNDLWPIDSLNDPFYWWKLEHVGSINDAVINFVNRHPVALLLDIRDEGTEYLERTAPSHVDIYYSFKNINQQNYEALIIISPFIYPTIRPTIYYRPGVLSLGFGCRENCDPAGIREYITAHLIEAGLSPLSVGGISTIDLKENEPVLKLLQDQFPAAPLVTYTADELRDIDVPNPSEKVREVTSVPSVAEACALKNARSTRLLLEKQKGKLSEGNDFTFAVALDSDAERSGFIEIVGAGPGDPELISVRGKNFLQRADLILYAGSLVPVELTRYAKPGATVCSSASMTLEEQFALMKEFYDKGLFIVRLHTGDPCIYGAIQEQMAFFDEHGMKYHITPGISSFQAAAAALQSQFTIPEKVQTIILTRGEGRTPMPEKEKLHLLARSQSTMCIFLSASIVDEVQSELMQHYPPTTPVAACYHLTWPDERIYRGELQHLAEIVKSNNLTLTTMIVVGEAIDNRKGQSKLYSNQFKHLFRN